MDYISVEELIKAGAHFGHPTSRWHPSFIDYISMKKNGVHIIDMENTSQCMMKAAQVIGEIVQGGGHVLFVGTKKQAKDAVQEAADRCGMYYIVERWLGGTLTNYGTIKKSIKRLTILEKESSEIYANLTKKELNSLERERLRLADLHRGIKDMKHLPSALFFVDGLHERIAISEARILGIPTIGIVDSNSDPTIIDYPIPANDDSMKTIKLIVNFIADSIVETTGGKDEEELSVEVSRDEVDKKGKSDSNNRSEGISRKGSQIEKNDETVEIDSEISNKEVEPQYEDKPNKETKGEN